MTAHRASAGLTEGHHVLVCVVLRPSLRRPDVAWYVITWVRYDGVPSWEAEHDGGDSFHASSVREAIAMICIAASKAGLVHHVTAGGLRVDWGDVARRLLVQLVAAEILS